MTSGLRRGGLLAPALFTVIGVAILLGLGTWQIERKAWKEALIAALDTRANAEPVALPPAERWSALTPDNDEFRRVRFTARLAQGHEALVYSAGSPFRSDVSGPGYWVFAPARLSDGRTVVVDRGFVPEGQQAAETHPATMDRDVTIAGALRWPESGGLFTPKNDLAHGIFFARDLVAMASAEGWGDVAPFYVELETTSGPAPLPRYSRLTPHLRNEHLQYAITWYGMAVILVVMFLVSARGRRRDERVPTHTEV